MVTFDLTTLTDWARRASGDRAQSTSETQLAAGSPVFTLANSGGISISSIYVDGTLESPSGYFLSGNVVTFTSNPTLAATIVFNYTFTIYTDDDIAAFLADAAGAVGADINVPWVTDTNAYTLSVDETQTISLKSLLKDKSAFNGRVLELITYKAALDVFSDKANTAASKSVLVQDGDTKIDTSKTAASSEKAIQRFQTRYDKALKVFRSEAATGQVGLVYQENVITFAGFWGGQWGK